MAPVSPMAPDSAAVVDSLTGSTSPATVTVDLSALLTRLSDPAYAKPLLDLADTFAARRREWFALVESAKGRLLPAMTTANALAEARAEANHAAYGLAYSVLIALGKAD